MHSVCSGPKLSSEHGTELHAFYVLGHNSRLREHSCRLYIHALYAHMPTCFPHAPILAARIMLMRPREQSMHLSSK
jgi:hypothetical protein